MNVIKIDAFDKKVMVADIAGLPNNRQFCSYLSPDKHTKNCRDWQSMIVTRFQQVVVKRASARAATVVLIDEEDKKGSPMWLIKGVQRPLFGNGLLIAYHGGHDQYFPCPFRASEVEALVTFC